MAEQVEKHINYITKIRYTQRQKDSIINAKHTAVTDFRFAQDEMKKDNKNI